MAIKFLTLSDIHLGEAPSLLNSDAGLAYFAEQLAGIVKKRDVDTIVLTGDIVDQAMSASATYEARAKAFFKTLLAVVPKPGKVVFLFGNHDLNLFRKLFCDGGAQSKFFVSGIKESGNPAVGELRKRLVGVSDVPFSVANPVYIQQTRQRVYLFHHGHHLRWDVNKLWSVFKLGDWVNLDQKVLGTELEFGSPAPSKATSLEEFENGTFPLVTTFWRNRDDVEVPRDDKIYAWIHKVSHPFVKSRTVAPGTRPYEPNQIPLDTFGRELITGRYFQALTKSQLLSFPKGKPVSLIYGDTHDAGYCATTVDATPLEIFNTGGWISYYRNVHPQTAVYTVEEIDGKEQQTLWEIGFPVEQVESMVDKMGEVLAPKALGEFEKNLFERLFKR